MRNERLWGLVLVALQCGLIGFVSGGYIFAILVMSIAGLGTFSRLRITIRPERLFIWTAVCIVFFLLKYRLAPVEFSPEAYFIRTDLMHEMARCLVFIQAFQFLIRYPNDQLPAVLPALGAAALVCASDVEMGRSHSIVVGVLAVTYALGWALFQMAWRQRDAVTPRIPSPDTTRRALRMRVVVVGMIFLTLVFSTGVIARTVVEYHRPIDEWLVKQVENWLSHWIRKDFGKSSVGFSERANLDSVRIRKSADDEGIALRVDADREPGYLRGQVYIDYVFGEWRSPSSLRFPIRPTIVPRGLSPSARNGSLFAYPGYELPDETSWRSLKCWRDESLNGLSFTTLETTHLQVETDELRFRSEGLFDLGDLPASFPYVAWELTPSEQASVPLVTLNPEEHTQYTNLSHYYLSAPPRSPAVAEKPGRSQRERRSRSHTHRTPSGYGYGRRFLGEDIPVEFTEMPVEHSRHHGDWVGKLAEVVFDGCETTPEKMAAVEQYFHHNYQYQLGIDIPEDRWHDPDPLQYFFEKKPAAHCEYFATAAVVLLRRAGVPARYVTGFVVGERNDIGGYWVARNRDAHAWCEAYDPQQGWTIVEATPASGIPQSTTTSVWQQWWEELKAAIARLQVYIGNRNWSLVWKTLWGSTTSVFTALILIGLVIWLYKRIPWRLRWTIRRTRPRDRWEAALSDLLHVMERELHPFGWKRSASETLHQFANRVARDLDGSGGSESTELESSRADAVAVWLRTFAHMRYTRQADEVMVLELQKSRPRL